MKTKTYLSLFLAITITFCAIGQTRKPMTHKAEHINISAIDRFLLQAYKFDSLANAIWESALKKTDGEKQMMQEEVIELRLQAQKLKLQAAELTYVEAKTIYRLNNSIIVHHSNVLDNQKTIALLGSLTSEAEELMERAQRLQGEVNSLQTTGAMVGAYYNLEELVNKAHEKQKLAIDFIRAAEQSASIALR
jgi:hypothetical protein